jgi:Flp pilus assembly protein protease CpaA
LETAALIILLFTLITISFQDLKNRLISWWLLPLLLLSLAFVSTSSSLSIRIEYALVNLGFLLAQYLLLSLYFIVKHKKWINIADQFLGWGDIIFFMVLVVGFSPLHFILLFVSGLLFSILAFVIYKWIALIKQTSVPLAGLFSIYLLGLEIAANLQSYSFFEDDFIISKISNIYA